MNGRCFTSTSELFKTQRCVPRLQLLWNPCDSRNWSGFVRTNRRDQHHPRGEETKTHTETNQVTILHDPKVNACSSPSCKLRPSKDTYLSFPQQADTRTCPRVRFQHGTENTVSLTMHTAGVGISRNTFHCFANVRDTCTKKSFTDTLLAILSSTTPFCYMRGNTGRAWLGKWCATNRKSEREQAQRTLKRFFSLSPFLWCKMWTWMNCQEDSYQQKTRLSAKMLPKMVFPSACMFLVARITRTLSVHGDTHRWHHNPRIPHLKKTAVWTSWTKLSPEDMETNTTNCLPRHFAGLHHYPNSRHQSPKS